MSPTLLGLAIVVAVTQASTSPPAPEPPAPHPVQAIESGSSASSLPSTPFQAVFTLPEDELPRRAQAHLALQLQRRAGATAVTPKVVCGMVIHQGDPKVDAGMIKRPVESAAAMHIKRIPLPTCTE